MPLKNLTESELSMILLRAACGKVGDCNRNEPDVRALIVMFARKVQKASGVKLSEPLVIGMEQSKAHSFHNKTPEEKARIAALIQQGMSNSQIERLTGVTRRTVANIRRDYLLGIIKPSADPMDSNK